MHAAVARGSPSIIDLMLFRWFVRSFVSCWRPLLFSRCPLPPVQKRGECSGSKKRMKLIDQGPSAASSQEEWLELIE